MNAAQIISSARARAGITQTELASRMGTHQSVIARWETGKAQPTLETVVRAVQAAGLELAVTISGETPQPDRRSATIPFDMEGLLREMKRLHAEQARLRWVKRR